MSGATSVAMSGVTANSNNGSGIALRAKSISLKKTTATSNGVTGVEVLDAMSFSDTDGNYSGNDQDGLFLGEIKGDAALLRTTLSDNDRDNNGQGDGLHVPAIFSRSTIGGSLTITSAVIETTFGGR